MPAIMHYHDIHRKGGQKESLRLYSYIRKMMVTYYKKMVLQGIQPKDLYELVMGEVEPALIAATMKYVSGNQSRAAKILGINRGTFRKKLSHYGML